MDFTPQLADLKRDRLLRIFRRTGVALEPCGDAADAFMAVLFSGRLPVDWRQQWRRFVARQVAAGFNVVPHSAQELEDWIENWARRCELLPLSESPGGASSLDYWQGVEIDMAAAARAAASAAMPDPNEPPAPTMSAAERGDIWRFARFSADLERKRIGFDDDQWAAYEYYLFENIRRHRRGEPPLAQLDCWIDRNDAFNEKIGSPRRWSRNKEASAAPAVVATNSDRQQTWVTPDGNREQFFVGKKTEAQNTLDEIRRVLDALGSKLDAAKLDEEVDVDAEADHIEELIWRYNDAMESARDAWLRDNLSGDANSSLNEMLTPRSFGLPWFIDEEQAARARRQAAQISQRLGQRDAAMDRLVVGMQVVEWAGTVAGFAIGGGAFATAYKAGGKWAIVKMAAVTAAVIVAEQAAEKGLRAAGAGEQTIRGVKLAALMVSFILLRRRSQAPIAEVPPRGVPTSSASPAAVKSPPSTALPSTGLVPKAPVELGKWGEIRLGQVLGGRGFKPKSPFQTGLGKRYVDRLVDRVAHEAKAGVNVGLTTRVRDQALKDAQLIANGTFAGAHWHFFQGAKQELLDFLTSIGIQYTVH